jgi:DNA invertase Pin-like site-specific DNA recombinase
MAEQESALCKYAEEHGYGVYGIFCDNGASGVTSDRPGLREMLRLIENGMIRRVLVSDLARLTRNAIQFCELKKALDQCEAELISAADGIVI